MRRRSEKRKINKLKVGIVVFIFLAFLLTISGFARFVYNNFRDRYLASRKFYFTSNLLEMTNKTYTYNNWDGTGIYELDLELYSKNNDLQVLEEDIEYNLMVTFPSNVNCTIDNAKKKTEDIEFMYPYEWVEYDKEYIVTEEYKQPRNATRTIVASNQNLDEVAIYLKQREEITPLRKSDEVAPLKKGDEILIDVLAYTTQPYKKTISATFKVKIETTFSIEDEHYQEYAILNLRNSTNEKQDVTIELNANEVLLDMNDDVFIYNKGFTTQEKTIPTVGYESFRYGHINKITFEMPKESMREIKLYKVNTYNKFNVNSGIVQVTTSNAK